jgi:arylsulfatase
MAMRWMGDKFWAFVPMQAVVGYFLETFKEFPQRQESASFSIEQVLQRLKEGSGAGK